MRSDYLPVLLLFGCPAPADSGTDSAPPEQPVYEDVLSAADGWLVGDLHAHTSYSSDGFDAVASQIAMASALEDPAFLEAHPAYQGHGLDFLAFTDHSSVEAAFDPDFVSDRLVLIPGAEWNFSIAEANLHGLEQSIAVDLEGDGFDADDLRAAVETVHCLGG